MKKGNKILIKRWEAVGIAIENEQPEWYIIQRLCRRHYNLKSLDGKHSWGLPINKKHLIIAIEH